MNTLFFAFLAAFVASLAFTPLVRTLARRVGLVDQPDGTRKLHGTGTALGGGIAVFCATAIAILGSTVAIWWLPTAWRPLAEGIAWREFRWEHFGILLGATIICTIGVLDDRWTLRGRQKLAGQCLAVVIIISAGVLIRRFSFLGFPVELGVMAVPFTMFWLLGAVNSLNLIDGADGMAGTVGFVLSIAVSAMAWLSGSPVEAVIAVALAGAILGFLVFNFPPASIFLGDAGSMLIGLTLGVVAIRSALKGPMTVGLAAPLALFAVPIFDSLAAVLRRQLTGRSIYTTDRGHLHHCLLRRGLEHRVMLLFVATLCGITAVGAFLSMYWQRESLALVSVAGMCGLLLVGRVFGHAELRLLANRLASFGASLIPRGRRNLAPVRQSTVRLQGTRNWDEIWEIITDFAQRHELCRVRLDVNVAWLHEGYHAVWERREMPDPHEVWMTKIPIATQTRTIGRLEITGLLAKESMYSVLSVLAVLLDSLEVAFDRLAHDPSVQLGRKAELSRQTASELAESLSGNS